MPTVLPVTLSVFLALATITVTLRWYARLLILRSVWFEDYLITASLVGGILLIFFVIHTRRAAPWTRTTWLIATFIRRYHASLGTSHTYLHA